MQIVVTDDLVNLVAHPGPSWIHAMRRKPGIAGLIKEREQQSALSAVGEQIEDPGHGWVEPVDRVQGRSEGP